MQEEDNYDDVRHIEESDMTVQSNVIDLNQKLNNSNINNQVDQSLHQDDESIQNQNQHQNLIQIPQQENLKQSLISPTNDNPMSSMPDLSQIEDIQEEEQEEQEVDDDLQMKQVITEVTDHRITITPQIFELAVPTTLELMDKHKQVLKTPRKEQQIEILEKQSLHQEVTKINLEEKYQSSEQLIETNLKEIYSFYAKQAQSTNRQATFDQLYQTTNIITLQKFMYFCKDFNLIDLEITNSLIIKLGGQPLEKNKINKLNRNKNHFILNKFLLVEIYKKNCSSQQELTFQLFLQILQRMSEIIFPSQKSIYLLYQYLEIKEPKLYRKKMLIVGKPFNTKEQIEKITQEKLYSRRIVLPPQPRAVTVKQEAVIAISIQEKEKPQKRQIKTLPKQPLLQWEDLNDISKDFDPKELLLEQDLSDKEDDIYLMEYQIKQPTLIKSKKQLVESVKQITTLNSKGINQSYELQPKESVKQRGKQMPTKAMLNQSYEVSQRDEFMKKAENNQKEREKQIYSTFIKKQTEREQRIKKK